MVLPIYVFLTDHFGHPVCPAMAFLTDPQVILNCPSVILNLFQDLVAL
jgi:hypothetical protein